jgi:uncharacterized protein involved in exopolysaccharide biosynthesis
MATPHADILPAPVPERPPLAFSAWVTGVVARWRLVLAGLAVAIGIAVLALLLIPPVYTARASFVATTTSSAGRLPASLSRFIGPAAQLGLSPDLQEPSESPAFYNQLIASRELRTRLLQSRFVNPRTPAPADSAPLISILKLRSDEPERRMELGLRALERSVRVVNDDRTNMVFLAVSSEWPELSAAIANRTLEMVAEFNQQQRTTRAGARRQFLEGRVANSFADLTTAEARHRSFLEQNRSWRSSPALVVQEEGLRREVDRAASLYLALQQQLETARLEEVNDVPLTTVIDSGVPPRKAAWPRYGILAASTLLTGAILGLMLAGFAAVLADWRQRNPESASALRGAVKGARADLGRALLPRRSRKTPFST